jgi:hypothetical protein
LLVPCITAISESFRVHAQNSNSHGVGAITQALVLLWQVYSALGAFGNSTIHIPPPPLPSWLVKYMLHRIGQTKPVATHCSDIGTREHIYFPLVTATQTPLDTSTVVSPVLRNAHYAVTVVELRY